MKAEEVIEEEVGNLPTLFLEDIKEYGRKIL